MLKTALVVGVLSVFSLVPASGMTHSLEEHGLKKECVLRSDFERDVRVMHTSTFDALRALMVEEGIRDTVSPEYRTEFIERSVASTMEFLGKEYNMVDSLDDCPS